MKGPCDSYSRGPFAYSSSVRRPGRAGAPTCPPGFPDRPVTIRIASMFYDVVHRAIPPLLRTVWRPDVQGLENIPRTGGVILASNHLSFVDSVVIPSVVPRKVVFLAKSDYFTGTGLKGALQRAWFEGLGMLP